MQETATAAVLPTPLEGRDMQPGTNAIVGTMQQVVRRDDGVTAIEYALLAALIVVASIGAISATGTSVSAMYVFWTTAVLGAL